MSWLAVFIGGGLGSILRFGLSRMVISSLGVARMPWATLFINILACGAMVLILHALSLKQQEAPLELQFWSRFWLIGFCGGFSTFSTFSYENYALLQHGQWLLLLINVLLSVALCLAVFVIAGRYLTLSV